MAKKSDAVKAIEARVVELKLEWERCESLHSAAVQNLETIQARLEEQNILLGKLSGATKPRAPRKPRAASSAKTPTAATEGNLHKFKSEEAHQ